jgi:hypothetical protein
MTWRARSASKRSDDWPFWYVTDDMPPDMNKTLDAIDAIIGIRIVALPFVPRDVAIALASLMNRNGALERGE